MLVANVRFCHLGWEMNKQKAGATQATETIKKEARARMQRHARKRRAKAKAHMSAMQQSCSLFFGSVVKKNANSLLLSF